MPNIRGLIPNKQQTLRLTAAFLSGCLMWMGPRVPSLWWLSFVAWVPILVAMRQQSIKFAFLLGLTMGSCAVGFGFIWMTDLLKNFGGLGWFPASLIHLLFSLSHGAMWGCMTALAVALAKHANRQLFWTFPLCWGAVEIIYPQVFPVHIAFFWSAHPTWIQSAEWIGAVGVSMLMVLINGLFFQLGRQRWQRKPLRHSLRTGICLIGLLVGIPWFGTMRMRQIDQIAADKPHLDIGVVQGNFGIKTRRKLRVQALHALQQMSADLQTQGAQLLLWGETSYPFGGFLRDSQGDLPLNNPRRIRKGFTVPLLFGLVTYKSPQQRRTPWNTAWLLEESGNFGDRYDKNYPLWFGESVPFVDPQWYLKKFRNATVLTLGDGPAVIRVNQFRLGPLICYEDLLANFSRDVIDQDVHALVGLINDSWFGKSQAQPDHFHLGLLRAVEHRRAYVRAVNAGISAFITPSGRIERQLPVTDSDANGYRGPDGFVAQVPMMDPEHRTFYAKFSPLFPWILWTTYLALLVNGLLKGRRSNSLSGAKALGS